MSKIDLTSSKWCDLIFEGKNKRYGAYVLRQESSKRHERALVIVFVLLVLVLLPILFSFNTPANNKIQEVDVEVMQLSDLPEPMQVGEEGKTVNYGTSDNGLGKEEPAPQKGTENIPETGNLTAPVILSTKKTKTSSKESSAEETQTSIAIEKENQQLLEEKKIAEENRKAEELRKAEAMRIQNEKREKALMAGRNAFGNGGKGTSTTAKGEGITYGNGNQGNPFGDVNSKNRVGGGTGNGHSFNLSGRSIIGSIPQPSYNSNEEGVIVVDIEVDRNGNVIDARAGGKGTTIGDSNMRKAAENAAKKAKFSSISSDITQTGTITYRYNLR